MKGWIIAGAIVVAGIGGLAILDEKATPLIEGEKFRALLDKETSKGMQFDAHYAPLTRVGLLGMHTDSFHGEKGQKTIVSLDAHDVSGWFNPWGLGFRRWQINDLHIKSGTVWLQKTESKPGEPKGPKPIPWTAIFWPYRVHLEDVTCDDADVLFKLRGQESGLYHIFLEITPNGRDFEYDGHGGTFKTPLTPELNLEHVHLLVRKPKLYCRTFVLGDDLKHPEERMTVNGSAGLQEDRTIRASAKIESLAVALWVPEDLRSHVLGHMSGQMEYKSTGTGVETATGHGNLVMNGLVLHELPAVRAYIKATASPDPGDLQVQTCQTDITYDQGAFKAENLKIECPGVFKIEGTLTLSKDHQVGGAIKLGITGSYLKWLPTAQTAIFTESDGDYHATMVHFWGDVKKPKQDLSPRILKEIEKSPLSAVKLFFNAL